MSTSDWLSIGLSDSGTDGVCRIEEPEKVLSSELQYDIDGCYKMMFSQTDKGSNTKSPGSGTRENFREWITLGYWWAHRNNFPSVRRTREHPRFEALNQLVRTAEKVPSTKSHYNMDRRVGMTFCWSVGLRNRQLFKHSFSWFSKQREFPALNRITIWISMWEWLFVHPSDSGTATVSRTLSVGLGSGIASQH